MTQPASYGLTAKQAWTAEHIVRCPVCGAWMVQTKRHGGRRPTTCQHLNPAQPRKVA